MGTITSGRRIAILMLMMTGSCCTPWLWAAVDEPLVRQTHIMRGQDYTLTIITKGGKEIARFKQSGDDIYDLQGTIPDGKVSFTDKYRNAYGDETYMNGKRHGIATTFYGTGELKSESYYVNGELQYKKEYYKNGTLRYEINLTSTLPLPDASETGIGKLYDPDGKLKYEWQMTLDSQQNFKKAYRPDGSLRFSAFYDKEGKLIE